MNTRINFQRICSECSHPFRGGNKAKYCIKCLYLSCERCQKKVRVVGKRRMKFRFCSFSCHGKTVLTLEVQRRMKHPKGKDHHAWNNGRTTHSSGYTLLNEGKKKFYEHRRVMELHLGRSLNRGEHVHHINGDKKDNRLENLMLFENAQAHALWHVKTSGRAHP